MTTDTSFSRGCDWGALETELLGRIEDQTDGRRLNQYFTTGFSKLSRNSIFHLIENEISTVFSEDIISSDPKLFSKAYVETPERLRYDKRIGMHLSKRQNVAPKAPLEAMSRQGRSAISGAIERTAESVRPLAWATITIIQQVVRRHLCEHLRSATAAICFNHCNQEAVVVVNHRQWPNCAPPLTDSGTSFHIWSTDGSPGCATTGCEMMGTRLGCVRKPIDISIQAS